MSQVKLDNLKKGLDKFGKAYIEELTKELLSADKKNTGNLIDSLEYEVVNVVNDLVLYIYADDYLNVVDEGRRPGAKMPPSNALLPWVLSKNIKIGNSTPEQTAFVVARSIGIKGIKPTGIKKKALDNVIRMKMDILSDAAASDIQEYIHKIIYSIK